MEALPAIQHPAMRAAPWEGLGVNLAASVLNGFWATFLKVFDTTSVTYIVIYFLLIIGFSYFYATIQFNPIEVANNLKKNGGFIPGFRPGKPTADFMQKVLSKITMFGAIYLSIVAILPIATSNAMGIARLAIGGTSVIIVVSVALETVKALEAITCTKEEPSASTTTIFIFCWRTWLLTLSKR